MATVAEPESPSIALLTVAASVSEPVKPDVGTYTRPLSAALRLAKVPWTFIEEELFAPDDYREPGQRAQGQFAVQYRQRERIDVPEAAPLGGADRIVERRRKCIRGCSPRTLSVAGAVI